MSDVQIAVIDQQDTQIVLAVPGVQGATGSSIPSGGTADQVLRKNSSTNYDANWTQVTSAMIADGAIVNADINNSAAIAGTKISPDFGGQAVTTTGQVNAARINVTANTAPTNGLYLPSANNVAISTGGTPKFRVDSSGNVALGPTLPVAAWSEFVVAGNAALQAAAPIFNFVNAAGSARFAYINHTGTGGDLYLLNQEAGNLRLGAGNNEKLRITSTGTVNIVGAGTAGSTQAVSFNGSAPVDSLVVDSSGNVGVGASPTQRLTVTATTNDNGIALNNSSANGGRIRLNSTGTGGRAYHIASTADGSGTGGGKFVIFDNTASDTARLVIDSSGRLLVGASSSVWDSLVEVVRVGGAQFAGHRYGANTFPAEFNFLKSRGTSVGINTRVSDGDIIGQIAFRGADDSSYVTGASITAAVDGNTGTNDMPGRLVFNTTADGAANPTERFRITNDGVIAHDQPAPAAVNATATLTIANLKAGIITSTSALATDMTLPTGTDTQAGFSGTYDNFTFEWSVINTGPSLVRVLAGTAHTVVGSGSVATGTSGRFASRRTGANTFVSYRLS